MYYSPQTLVKRLRLGLGVTDDDFVQDEQEPEAQQEAVRKAWLYKVTVVICSHSVVYRVKMTKQFLKFNANVHFPLTSLNLAFLV